MDKREHLIKIYGETCTVVQVNKVSAKKAYNDGKELVVIPCKLRLDNSMIPFVVLHNSGVNFDTLINEYEAYNCNSEVGEYPHFYIKK